MKARDIMDSTKNTGKSRPPIEVESCFSGMAIYKRDVIFKNHSNRIQNSSNHHGHHHNQTAACQYNFRHDNAPYLVDCEHIFFHQCLREKNQARIFTNLQQKLWYGHSGKLENVKVFLRLRRTKTKSSNSQTGDTHLLNHHRKHNFTRTLDRPEEKKKYSLISEVK